MSLSGSMVAQTESRSGVYCIRKYLEDLLGIYGLMDSNEEWVQKLASLLEEFPDNCAFLEEEVKDFFENDELFAEFRRRFKENFVGAVK